MGPSTCVCADVPGRPTQATATSSDAASGRPARAPSPPHDGLACCSTSCRGAELLCEPQQDWCGVHEMPSASPPLRHDLTGNENVSTVVSANNTAVTVVAVDSREALAPPLEASLQTRTLGGRLVHRRVGSRNKSWFHDTMVSGWRREPRAARPAGPVIRQRRPLIPRARLPAFSTTATTP
jgi:hypothetical protein